MTWQVELQEQARRDLRKLSPEIQRRILGFLRNRLATNEDPRRLGKALQGGLASYWRYRIGDYRLICEIRDAKVKVLVVAIRHRSKVYR